MIANLLKRALRDGRPQIGLWSSLSSHISTEIIAGSGFDWLLLDMEHSPNALPTVHRQLQAMQGSSTVAVVRPAWNDAVLFKRLLDIGVQSLLVPFVQNAAEARRAVAATRYPPDGIRGVATASMDSSSDRTTWLLTWGTWGRADTPTSGRRSRRRYAASRRRGRLPGFWRAWRRTLTIGLNAAAYSWRSGTTPGSSPVRLKRSWPASKVSTRNPPP